MNITENIKKAVETYIYNVLIDTPQAKITAEEILTSLAECEVLDTEYSLYDSEGGFDSEKDQAVLTLVMKYIETQLK